MSRVPESRYEKITLSYLLRDKENVEYAIQNGMNKDWFLHPDLRDIFVSVSNYYVNTGNLFTKSVFMDFIRKDPKTDPETYFSYEVFYDDIHDAYPDDNSFDHYFQQFKDDSLTKLAVDCISEFVEENKRKNTSLKTNLNKLTKQLISLQSNIEEQEWQVIDFVNEIDPQLEDIHLRRSNPEKYAGVRTYYPSIDRWYNGFERGSLNVIAGRPGTGKSTLMKCISWQQCINNKKVVVVSCEDDRIMWSYKIISAETGIPLTSIVRGQITEEQEAEIRKYKEEFKKAKEVKKDSGGYAILQLGARRFTVPNIEMIVENHFRDWVPDIVFVDQISLIKPHERYNSRIDMEFGIVTKGLRALAKKWNIPIVAASQVDRASVKEKRGQRVTEIFGENLAQSDQVFQDSDSIFAIQLDSQDKEQCNLKIIKQRNGATDIVIGLRFEREICSFKDPEFLISESSSEFLVETSSSISKEAREVLEKEKDRYDIMKTLDEEEIKILSTGNKEFSHINSKDLIRAPINSPDIFSLDEMMPSIDI